MAGAGQSNRQGPIPPSRFDFGSFVVTAAPFVLCGVLFVVGSVWGAGAVVSIVVIVGLCMALADGFGG